MKINHFVIYIDFIMYYLTTVIKGSFVSDENIPTLPRNFVHITPGKKK
jgi:hypothetical protein